AQDLAGGGLLLERLGEGRVLGLKLGEEADVLDGDDGLVGEGLDQGDLLVEEGAHFEPEGGKAPDGNAVAKKGDGEQCPMAEAPLEVTADRKLRVGLGGQGGGVLHRSSAS